jgi:gliding motility-associated-like protein
VLGLKNSLKYNFILAPYANADNIKLYYEGLDKIMLEKETLKLTTSVNELYEQKPYAYQQIGNERVEVFCKFVLENTTVSFSFPHGYNKEYDLVIDPVLVFAASSGSLSDNFGMTATYDADGNLYSGGTSFDQGYPTTLGAYDRTYNGIVENGRTDVVITKYDSSGTFLRYSTYLGGAVSTEIVTSLVVNAQNELLLYGATGSSDFPITANAFDKTFKGGNEMYFYANGTYYFNGTDIYVSKFNTSGTSLLSSTFVGGTENDGVNTNESNAFFGFRLNPVTGKHDIPVFTSPSDSLQYNYGDQYRGEINVDKFGNVCISSSTRSSDFPIVNGFDNTLGGQQDAVVFKLNSDLSQIVWSTFLGGSNNDAGYALALDDSANVYVTGGTRSFNFPATVGALKTSFSGGKADGYIAKIKFDGSAILHATYLGTAKYDQSYFVQLDKNNNIYVVGQTEGKMPVTDSSNYFNAYSSQFISKFNNSLTTLIFSTVFGNGDSMPNISPSAFLVDDCENIYVSGWGGNIETGIPTTGMPLLNAIQPTTDGFNFYLIVLAKDAASLLYATYFGGAQSQEHVDGGTSRFDKRGVVYQSVCAGCWGNDDFPVTPGAWPGTPGNPNHNSLCNNGVFKFDFEIPMVQADFTVNKIEGCDSLTVNFKNKSTTGSAFLWDFGGGDTTSVIANPTRTFLNPGEYLVKLYVTNPSSCNNADTTFNYITIYPIPVITNAKNNYSICSGSSLNIPLTSDVNSTFTWVTAANASISGESSIQKTSTIINDVLVNTTSFDQILTYTIVPTSIATHCAGEPFFINILVHPEPVHPNNNVTICSGNALTILLNSSVNSSYTWVASNNTNVSGESTALQTANSITDVLVNATSVNQTLTYTITPTSTAYLCAGAPFYANVLVAPLPSALSTTNYTVCSGNALNIALSSNINSTYGWSTSDNVNVSGESISLQTGTTINDVLLNLVSSNQPLTYTVTPTSVLNNCLGNPYLINVLVATLPVITNNGSSICSGNQLNITFASTMSATYVWSATNNINTTGETIVQQTTNGINDIVVNLSAVNQTITYSVAPVSNINQCRGIPDVISVIVYPAPNVNTNNSISICSGVRENIPLQSTVNSTYKWIAANNNSISGETTIQQTTTNINDSLINSTVSNQTVIYTIIPTSVLNSCVGAAVNINVLVVPTPLVVVNTTSVCSGDVSTIQLTSNISSTFVWVATNNISVSGESLNPQVTNTINDTLVTTSSVNQTVVYTITATSIAGQCVGNSNVISVIVYPGITADFDFETPFCSSQVLFHDSSAFSPVSWLWHFDDGDSSTVQNPKHTYTKNGIYNVELITFSKNNCKDTALVQLDFKSGSIAISKDTTICINKSAQLNVVGGMLYNWLPQESLSDAAIANPIASPNVTTTYTVSVSSIQIVGDTCTQTLSTTVNVIDPALYSIVATADKDSLFHGESTILHAITDSVVKVTWLASSGVKITDSANVIVTPETTTTYTVSILESSGCPKSAILTIYVIECDPATIFVPNTFTPNGDGKNDILYVRGNEITELYFAVYNRWGQLVFETTDITKGWNGIYNGIKADPAVFAWYLRGKCFNGEMLEKKGNVTLIR